MSLERLTEIQSQGAGMGIRGMREGVRHFRGDLVVESNGFGTRVCARLPLRHHFQPTGARLDKK